MAAVMFVLSMTMTAQAFLTTSRDNLGRTVVLYSDRQAEYGKSLEMPSTYVTCGQCGSSYALKKEDLGDGGKGRYVFFPGQDYAVSFSAGSSFVFVVLIMTSSFPLSVLPIVDSRLECSVCGHAWFQSQNRIMEIGDQFEMVELPERDMKRIQRNIEEGKSPKYMGATKLYVGNIAFSCTEDDLWELFENVGGVGEVSLVRDDQGRNRGFAFITMREKADGEKAMTELDGMELHGRALSVKESNN